MCVWRTSCAGVGFNCVAHFACQYQHTIHCSYYRPTSTPTSDREIHTVTHTYTQTSVLHLSSAKISYTNFNSVSNNKQNTQQLKHTNTPTPTNSHSQSYTVTHTQTAVHSRETGTPPATAFSFPHFARCLPAWASINKCSREHHEVNA